jgi:hypothetical protein
LSLESNSERAFLNKMDILGGSGINKKGSKKTDYLGFSTDFNAIAMHNLPKNPRTSSLSRLKRSSKRR